MGRTPGLANEQRRALARLSQLPQADRLVLVGGTALAIQLQHRRSLDLDLFGDAELDLSLLQEAIVGALPDARVVASTDAALQIQLGNTPVDIVRYRYPLLEDTSVGPEGIRVASLRDLAAMKMAAIGKRGLRRDFWDLYVIAKDHVSLPRIAEDYLAKFGKAESDLYHVARSLTYFVDAERESKLPVGMDQELWSELQSYFRAHAKQLLAAETD